MSDKLPPSSSELLTNPEGAEPILVTRSVVPAGLNYPEYKSYLRRDFFYSCAYCTMCEAEAMAKRFTIDHYEPRNARPDLEHAYDNLMYACDECNTRKGDRCPPIAAREAGFRFYRPDTDRHDDHFEHNGIRLNGKTPTGEFTVETIDLNRTCLRRLRHIRQRASDCHRYMVTGIASLRNKRLDQLPQHIKFQATKNISALDKFAGAIEDELDTLLRKFAMSPLVDPEPLPGDDEEKRASERDAKLKRIHALHPGAWRAPRSKKGKAKKS